MAAVKCTNCESYQNWLGKVHLSTTTLSLLVALIATSVSAVPVLSEMLTRHDSKIYVRLRGATGDGLTAFAVNAGTRPGFVSGGWIETSDGIVVGLSLVGGENRLVRPGTVEVLTYRAHEVKPLATLRLERDCHGKIMVVNFGSDEDTTTFPLSCYAVSHALRLQEFLDKPEASLPAPAEIAEPARTSESARNSTDQ